jgi:hypothetical protein
MCGSKCKCVDCANFAGSQKLIDKRRKIKDQRGAELAMKVAEQAWKGPHNSSRKLPVARPAVHGMRPMPSPVATPGGRMPMGIPPHMMHPSPSGHHHYMRHPFMGYSPMGMPHHVSPSAYGMFQHHIPPPTHTPVASQKHSPIGGATMKPPASVVKEDSAKRETPPKTPACSDDKANAQVTDEKNSRADSTIKSEEISPVTKNINGTHTTTSTESEVKATPESQPSLLDRVLANSKASSSPRILPTPKEKPDVSMQPTPVDNAPAGAAKITPMPATPAPSVRLAYQDSDVKGQPTEVFFPYFGKLPNLSERMALDVFSFLPEADIDGVKIVCKSWNHLLPRDTAA